ncbi:amidohydrolase family protein [Marinivivus vitaminiproducens]|uniref:amidohydrolase family protein n=1 Tax=Marinivivus vitaminiproducens TaxID=3035935 RepID=UPI00279D34C1|nr:amidohydrolase family protein [Geminicoccaceae bacterium SCSIO 64248]
MSIELLPEKPAIRAARQLDAVIDCDIHPAQRSPEDLRPFMSRRWWDYWKTYGFRSRHGLVKGTPFPKIAPNAARRDAWPESGSPGSDLAMMQTQHLDHHNIAYGVLNPLNPTGGDQNADFSAALCSAMNDWLIEAWTRHEPRLKASIMVPYEDGEASRQEIHRRAGTSDFVHVLLLSRTSEPLGKRRYWPIFEAASEHNLPVATHVFGYSGFPSTGGGWPSYYVEEGANHPGGCQASIASMIFEGVFERFPTLKLLVIEAGFAWLPPLAWRLDKIWHRMRDEVPHVTRPPSEYIRDHVWITTQPMEEAPNPRQVVDIMGHIGWDRLMFASDYPHWDFDDPRFGLPGSLSADQRQAIRFGNAHALYGF